LKVKGSIIDAPSIIEKLIHCYFIQLDTSLLRSKMVSNVFELRTVPYILIDVRPATSCGHMIHLEGEATKVNDNTFEIIMQELFKQKQRLDELKKENQELRSHLAELREGRGISIDILGQRFSPVLDAPEPLAASQGLPISDQAADKAISTISIEASPNRYNQDEGESLPSPSPAFLQEMIFDELASAATGPLAIGSDSATGSSLQAEEEKAALRNELTDSYLLG